MTSCTASPVVRLVRAVGEREGAPSTSFEGKPVTPEEFWTSMFFSTPASRAMVKFGRSRDLLSLYRDGFQNADEFVSVTRAAGYAAGACRQSAFALRRTAGTRKRPICSHRRRGASNVAQADAKPQCKRAARLGSRSQGGAGSRGFACDRPAEGMASGWPHDNARPCREPAFQSLKGDPRFEAVRKRILDHIARERAELGR